MTRTINQNKLKNFHKAYKTYNESFVRVNKLGKSMRDKISDELSYIESKSSVEIERQKCSS